MEGEGKASYASAMALNQSGIPHVPHRYILPPSERPHPIANFSTTLPIIDISVLHDHSQRCHVIDEIRRACKEIGFFQVFL